MMYAYSFHGVHCCFIVCEGCLTSSCVENSELWIIEIEVFVHTYIIYLYIYIYIYILTRSEIDGVGHVARTGRQNWRTWDLGSLDWLGIL